MNHSILRHALATLGLAALGAMISPLATAACVDMGGGKAPTWRQPASWQQNAEPSAPEGYSDRESERAGIVGFWQIQFVARGDVGIPDGTVVDSGYVTWHSDGTELMNSGRPPITGNFCMGAWKQTGKSAYKLNHFALGWDASGNNLIGPANIREQVTLDRDGNKFTGTFTIDQYDTQGNVLAHVAGTVMATRITAD